MLEDLQLKGATLKTKSIYLREVRTYVKCLGKSLSGEEKGAPFGA